MEIHRYRITGIVQGVGFRPFVHKLCQNEKLNGWILNDSHGVLIEIEGEHNSIIGVFREIKNNPPQMAKIDKIIQLSTRSSSGVYSTFSIKKKHEKRENKYNHSTGFFCL